jgi:hypothetical protein
MIMRIGSEIVNLKDFVTIECYQGTEYPEIMIEYPRTVKRFRLPFEMNPERVAAVIHHKIVTEPNGFSLIECLKEHISIYGKGQ